MEQGSPRPATIPTISALGHRSDATLGEIVQYAETLNWGTLCVTLEDEQGRFRIWASNLGALQPADSLKSLDRRLNDAPLMRKSVVSGLERLEGSAKRALAILNKSAPNRSISGDNSKPTTELDELLLSIRSSINHLFGLSMLIRRQRPRGRIPEVEGIALESSPDISYLTDKHPKAKSNMWLAQRLGNNITQQRRLIQYRQYHRESLAKRDVKGSDPTDAATIVATTFQEESNPSGTNQTPQDADSSRMSVFTSATSFLTLEDGTATARSIPDLLDMVLDGVQLDYGEPFECPYCRTIQNVGNRYEWKRHVFTDLQPYVCTFKECAISSKAFTTRAEWFRHESTVHRLQWSCNWCSQTDTTFHTAEDLKKHLNNTHSGMVTEAQMPLILETCERPIKSFGSESCPLCTDWEPPSTRENVKSFSRHLARHLQQLALEALPLSIDGLEIRDASGLSDAESLASYGSGDEETTRNQSDDGLSALIQTMEDQHAIDMAARLGDIAFNPDIVINDPTYSRHDSHPAVREDDTSEVAGDSALEQIKGKAPITPGAAESSQIKESIGGSENFVTEDTRNRREWSEPIGEEEIAQLEKAAISSIERGVDAAVAHETMEKAVDELVKRMEENPEEIAQLSPELRAHFENLRKRKEKAPVRFKDAVGRKFSFPFHLCDTWQGMEELIKQAFLHVDVLGPHVMEGRYDLMGPDGEIILPSVWEKVIQPDMSITMAMWPMDNYPPPPARSASGGALKPPRGTIPIPPGTRDIGSPRHPVAGPPNAPERYRIPATSTIGSTPVGKPVRRSAKVGVGMAEFLFGKPQKKRKEKAVPSSSADQQNEE